MIFIKILIALWASVFGVFVGMIITFIFEKRIVMKVAGFIIVGLSIAFGIVETILLVMKPIGMLQ